MLTTEKAVLINENDKTLRRADWQDGTGEMLGRDPPPTGTSKSNFFFDFTESKGVFSLHDYFTINVNHAQHQVIKALICDKVFYPMNYKEVLSDKGGGVYSVGKG
jgi:hypothetical protein